MLLVQTHPVKELVIIYVEGGGGAKLFYKEVWGVSQLIARYIQDRGSLAKMGRAVKQ